MSKRREETCMIGHNSSGLPISISISISVERVSRYTHLGHILLQQTQLLLFTHTHTCIYTHVLALKRKGHIHTHTCEHGREMGGE
jgi:hypothetical protein